MEVYGGLANRNFNIEGAAKLLEFYFKDIPVYKSCVEILKQFDYVVFMFVASDPFLPFIKGHSQYMPAGIDCLNFSPYPNPPQRVIDVLSIGRRAPATHKALLKMARDDNKFYMYDTINAGPAVSFAAFPVALLIRDSS